MPDIANGTPAITGPLTENQAAEQLAALISPSEDNETPAESHQDEDLPEGEQYESDSEQTEPEGEDAPQPEEDVESEPDEETEAPAPEPRKLKVKVGDTEEELTEDEVVKGYLRTADYTRKTQALAEARKAAEADFTQVKAERAKYAQDFAHIETILKAQRGPEPDWDTLRATDPIGYAQAYADYDRQSRQIAAVEAEKARAEAVVAADNLKAHNARIEAEKQKLPELIPAWKDEKVMASDMTAIATYAESMGWTKADLRGITDARLIALVNKARLYDAAQANKPKIQKQISSVVTRSAAPGTVSAPAARVGADKAIQRAKKTGDPKDVAAAMARLLNG